jgi:hypothetical protein
VKLVIAPQALSDIEVAARWWRINRPAAPELFERELLAALDFIRTVPLGGAPLRAPRPIGVRRTALPMTRYLL